MNFFHWFRKKKPIDTKSITLTGNEIFNKLHNMWPSLTHGKIWFEDGKYLLPTRSELEKKLLESVVESYEYVPEIEDCGDFALLLHGDIIRSRYDDYKAGKIPDSQLYPWAFGQIWYQDTVMGPHAINICITSDEGILLVEPQSDEIRKATPNMVVFFIRF